MFILELKYEDGTYGIRDTEDNSLDKCTKEEIRSFIKQGLPIQGVTVTDNRIRLTPVNKSGFKGTAVRTVKSASQGNDMSIFSSSQRQVVENYFVWETVSLYKSLAKTIRLGVQESKIVELTKLRGNSVWEFGGIVDTGYYGGSTCALGHPIRYEFIALGKNEETGEEDALAFGETCASDFLDISKEDLSHLSKVRKSMSEEISIMVDLIKNPDKAQEIMNSFSDLDALLSDIHRGKSTLSVLPSQTKSTLNNFIVYFSSFKKVGIPYPSSLVKAFSRFLNTNKLYITLCRHLYSPLFLTLRNYDIPDESGTVYQYWQSASAIERNIEHALGVYVWFFFRYKVEGCYAYDPINGVAKAEGGFSKRAKAEREGVLSVFKKVFLTNEVSYYLFKTLSFNVLNFTRFGKMLYKDCNTAIQTAKRRGLALDDILESLNLEKSWLSLVKTAYCCSEDILSDIRKSYVPRHFENLLSNKRRVLSPQAPEYVVSLLQVVNSIDYTMLVKLINSKVDELMKSADLSDEKALKDITPAKLKEIRDLDLYNYYERAEIKQVCRLLSKVDKSSSLYSYIINNSKGDFVFTILETVLGKERCSDKQLFYITRAYNAYYAYMEASKEVGDKSNDSIDKTSDSSSTPLTEVSAIENVESSSVGNKTTKKDKESGVLFNSGAKVPSAPDDDFIF